MRENMGLYRGKRKDNGEWETGSLVVIRPDCSDQQTFIADKMTGYHTPVLPETVGQYTGVKTYSKHDDELHKIFEDDLCYVTEFDCDGNDEQHLCQVMFDCGTFYFKDVNSDWCRAFYEIGDIESDVELVGNIHDNPEILKGGEDNG